MWKARCSKTLLGKHFLFGALARCKAQSIPLPCSSECLSAAERSSGEALEPWQMWWGCSSPSCSRESPPVCAKFLYLGAFVPTGFGWVLVGWFWLLLLFGIFFFIFIFFFWGGFCRTEEGITHREIQDLCCCSLSKTRGWQRLMAAQKVGSVVMSCLSWVNTFSESFVWTRTEKLSLEQGNNLCRF